MVKVKAPIPGYGEAGIEVGKEEAEAFYRAIIGETPEAKARKEREEAERRERQPLRAALRERFGRLGGRAKCGRGEVWDKKLKMCVPRRDTQTVEG